MEELKKTDKVNRRIGRAQQKYPSVQGWYDLRFTGREEDDIVEDLTWEKNPEKENNRESGIYFLRTSLKNRDEEAMWMIYNVTREVEYTFSVLKTDLDLRPIYHKSDKTSMAHLHFGHPGLLGGSDHPSSTQKEKNPYKLAADRRNHRQS
jgi:hypothetical protein